MLNCKYSTNHTVSPDLARTIEWFTYRDWLNDTTKVDIRQLLLETHNLPQPGDDPHKNKGGHWFPAKTPLTPSQFFDDIERAGFAMYSKEPNIHPQAGVRKSMVHLCLTVKTMLDYLTSSLFFRLYLSTAQGNGVEFAYIKLHPDFFQADGN